MKTCLNCKKKLVRKDGEYPSELTRRKLCNNDCKYEYMKNNRIGHFGIDSTTYFNSGWLRVKDY